MPAPVTGIILVYNGDSGVRAMLLDVLKKAVGREDCALCEITYSPVGRRRAWAACESRLGLPVEELHRDRLPGEWGIARADLPCILGRVEDPRPIVLLSRAEIVSCRGHVEMLEQRLREALDYRTPTPS
jgi:hypothetical protein